jgi:chromosome segregation ATPase
MTMPKATPDRSALVAAAAQLEEELSRYEKLTDEVGRVAIGSEKTLARAARAVQDAAACHERIMESVGALSEAMNATRARQESSLVRMAEAARHVGERATAFRALLARYASLGEVAKTLNASVTEIAAHKADGAAPSEVITSIAALVDRMGGAVTEADELTRGAKESSFDDLARDADALKQQIHSARNRLVLVQRTLAERAPS